MEREDGHIYIYFHPHQSVARRLKIGPYEHFYRPSDVNDALNDFNAFRRLYGERSHIHKKTALGYSRHALRPH